MGKQMLHPDKMQYRGIKYKQDGLCNDTPYNKFKTF
jgi:hypothetical protein